ncbi:Dynein heavy chain 1 [Durusdinium trenchii]|uniref:Axonemal n=1 Tax=Durusdinium trenchii TaxID=1381693 RepID=A0ABP0K186_9DINO
MRASVMSDGPVTGDLQEFHYELRIVLPPTAPAQEVLDSLRSAGHELLPRGPAHISLGEFTSCASEESAKLALLAAVCREALPGGCSFHVHGPQRRRSRRGASQAFFLPVDLATNSWSKVKSFENLKFLQMKAQNFHISMGRGVSLPEMESWEGSWDQLSVIKLDRASGTESRTQKH